MPISASPAPSLDSLHTRREITLADGSRASYFSLPALSEEGLDVSRFPVSIRVILEALLRSENGRDVSKEDIRALCSYDPEAPQPIEIPFKPARVILQDFTGVPAVVDLAAMRSAMIRMGGDPRKINPQIPVDLIIDHSVQVDVSRTRDAEAQNSKIEFERNAERYTFLRWGQSAFDNFNVVPPSSGIVHQVNLEYLASGVQKRPDSTGRTLLFPDTLVGTDSHTTMINGLGVVGWGVGGIEAEAVMLGQPIYMLAPEVVGVSLDGRLPLGATATDLALTLTQMLRKAGVVGKFVEFYGKGLKDLSLADRATIANMAPEYGATMGFFPVDDETLNYLRATGRPDETVDRVERYTKAQGLFGSETCATYAATLNLDLGEVEPSLAGPKRPQDRIGLSRMKEQWGHDLRAPIAQRGFAISESELAHREPLTSDDAPSPNNPADTVTIGHGSVMIAAITSCTNTSNPMVMLAAGLLARNAVRAGLHVAPHIKCSLAPGSRVVTDYLQRAELSASLEKLGFYTVGYGCTTCIGNSGPLAPEVVSAIQEGNLVAAAVLSGNRNFEGRVNPHTRANYLASPPLVVAYALAGTVDIDLTRDSLGKGSAGKEIFLRDIWPEPNELSTCLETAMRPETFHEVYHNISNSNERWNAISAGSDAIYSWNEASTYIHEPPFFVDMDAQAPPIRSIEGASVLLKLADSITTDHISPAGAIPPESPAAQYLESRGIGRKDYNSFGSRRGDDRVMTRGTFGNIRLKNLLAPGTEGGWTTHIPSGEVISVYEAAQRYQAAATPTIVLAGRDYGMGSSRDWAAKGTLLLGVKAVIAVSFERIHRSNLVGMGILPLEFEEGESPASLGLSGNEIFTIILSDKIQPRQQIRVDVEGPAGQARSFTTKSRIDTPVEIDYYRNGGILHYVLRTLL